MKGLLADGTVELAGNYPSRDHQLTCSVLTPLAVWDITLSLSLPYTPVGMPSKY